MMNSRNPPNQHGWSNERRMSDADAEAIANHMVDKLVTRLSDEATVDALMSVWTGQFDKHVGRSIRRGFWVLVTALTVFIAVRFDSIMAWFKR